MLGAFIVNRILYGCDCPNILNDELALPTDSVDVIYLDPPCNARVLRAGPGLHPLCVYFCGHEGRICE